MVSATVENEIMVAENGLPECSPPPNIPRIELINFFGRVGTVVGVKSLTPVCLTPGFFFPPWGNPSIQFPFKWNLREQRILLIILKALCP